LFLLTNLNRLKARAQAEAGAYWCPQYSLTNGFGGNALTKYDIFPKVSGFGHRPMGHHRQSNLRIEVILACIWLSGWAGK
tara:strand:- start:500 stop:739 length:240 start_codon:yes stop_codon:yes gene_type:complete